MVEMVMSGGGVDGGSGDVDGGDGDEWRGAKASDGRGSLRRSGQ